MAQQLAVQCPCHPAWASAWTTSAAGFPSWMLCPSVGSSSAPWTAQGLCALPSASLGVALYSCRSLWAPSLRGKSPLGALLRWTEPFQAPSPDLSSAPQASGQQVVYPAASFSSSQPRGPAPHLASCVFPGLPLTKGHSSAYLRMSFILCYLLA